LCFGFLVDLYDYGVLITENRMLRVDEALLVQRQMEIISLSFHISAFVLSCS
jgi:hypothetical protein